MNGYVSSIQSMGTLDGPGVRFVVFLQGCNLRCGCCHNPETQSLEGGTLYTAEEIADKCEKYKAYFGEKGGITLSGGEPLMQSGFAKEIFSECKKRGINTCLDTSGSLLNNEVLSLLDLTDCVLLDIKYNTDELYRQYVGCSLDKPLEFLKVLNQKGIPTVIRQVIVPCLNDNAESISFLKAIREKHSCVEKIELLPFKKICKTKYDNLGIAFPFESFKTPSAELMQRLEKMIKDR